MYPMNVNSTEILALNRQAHVEGFVAGVIFTAAVWSMYKLNKATIKDRLKKLVSSN